MAYKNTIQDKIRRAKLQLGNDYGDEQMMEEAIFKAGMQEVVEWIEKEFGYFTAEGLAKIIIDDGGYYGSEGSIAKYQAKLKEWNVKTE